VGMRVLPMAVAILVLAGVVMGMEIGSSNPLDSAFGLDQLEQKFQAEHQEAMRSIPDSSTPIDKVSSSQRQPDKDAVPIMRIPASKRAENVKDSLRVVPFMRIPRSGQRGNVGDSLRASESEAVMSKMKAATKLGSRAGTCACIGDDEPGHTCVMDDSFGMEWCYIPSKESCSDAVEGICEGANSCQYWSEMACGGAATTSVDAAPVETAAAVGHAKKEPLAAQAPAAAGGKCACIGDDEPGHTCVADDNFGMEWCYIPSKESCVDAVEGICEGANSCQYWSEMACSKTAAAATPAAAPVAAPAAAAPAAAPAAVPAAAPAAASAAAPAAAAAVNTAQFATKAMVAKLEKRLQAQSEIGKAKASISQVESQLHQLKAANLNTPALDSNGQARQNMLSIAIQGLTVQLKLIHEKVEHIEKGAVYHLPEPGKHMPEPGAHAKAAVKKAGVKKKAGANKADEERTDDKALEALTAVAKSIQKALDGHADRLRKKIGITKDDNLDELTAKDGDKHLSKAKEERFTEKIRGHIEGDPQGEGADTEEDTTLNTRHEQLLKQLASIKSQMGKWHKIAQQKVNEANGA